MERRKYFSMILVGGIALIGTYLLYMSCAQNQDIAGLKKGNASGDVCPKCSSHNVGRWVYGLVDKKLEDSAFVAKIRKGKVHLGGCAVSSDSPMYHCNSCGSDWGDSYEIFNK
jgi:hypothetical protein